MTMTMTMTLNKSKTKHVRSTNFLMQARSPEHQDNRTLSRLEIGHLVLSQLILENFVKISQNLLTFRLFVAVF